MSTEGQSPSGLAAVLNALKDFRVPPQLSLGASVTSAVLLWGPALLPQLKTPSEWQPAFILVLVAGIALFGVGEIADLVLDARKVRRAHRDAEQARSHEIASSEARRVEMAKDWQIAEKQNAESVAASEAKVRGDRERFLRSMTLNERALCVSFVSRNFRSQLLAVNGEVLELTRRGVLEHMPGDDRKDPAGGRYSHYTMSDWAWTYFAEHPNALAPPPAPTKPS